MDSTSTTTAVTAFTDAISKADFSGLLEGVTSSLPIIIPVMVGFLAVRKGISFLFGNLRRA